jgi:hypothetical protein
VCPGGEHASDAGNIATGGEREEFFVGRIEFGAAVLKEVDQLGVVVERCFHERRGAVLGGEINVSSTIDKEGEDREVAMVQGVEEGGNAGFGGLVGKRSVGEKIADDVWIPELGGRYEWTCASAPEKVHICAAFQKSGDGFKIFDLAGSDERISHVIPVAVRGIACIEQSP